MRSHKRTAADVHDRVAAALDERGREVAVEPEWTVLLPRIAALRVAGVSYASICDVMSNAGLRLSQRTLRRGLAEVSAVPTTMAAPAPATTAALPVTTAPPVPTTTAPATTAAPVTTTRPPVTTVPPIPTTADPCPWLRETATETPAPTEAPPTTPAPVPATTAPTTTTDAPVPWFLNETTVAPAPTTPAPVPTTEDSAAVLEATLKRIEAGKAARLAAVAARKP